VLNSQINGRPRSVGWTSRRLADATGQGTEGKLERPSGSIGSRGNSARQSSLYVQTSARPARRSPIPSLIDPTFIPGTPENNRVAGAVADALEGLIGALGSRLSRSARSRSDEYEAACLEQHRQDMVNCQIVRAAKGTRAWIACKEAAGQRLAECLRDGADGTRTPPYWRK
jgi:hypothetical protein